jgi:predicted amidohydrolase YtcJ
MRLLLLFFAIGCLASCSQKKNADLLIYNATIYTLDTAFSKVDAMVISEGKILASGAKADLQKKYVYKEKVDAKGAFIYPGFIDAHAHFVGYANGLQTVDLVGTTSWDDIIEKLKRFAASHPDGWLLGRGWDQNDWPSKQFPDNATLNAMFPGRPVFLTRIDGHAAIANKKALDIAAIPDDIKLTGGEIIKKNGKPTGVLVDHAIDLVSSKIPPLSAEQFRQSLREAEKNCFAAGLTTIDDCGLSSQDVDAIKKMQDDRQLSMRLYVMLSDDPANYEYLNKKGIIKTDRLDVRGFKVYGDGALGSRGACLLRPYQDQPGHYGFLLSEPRHFDSVAAWIFDKGFQMCTHAIGDSGNRTILKTYAKYLKGKNDRRWRIEHAQVIDRNDFTMFGRYSIIPSVQPTHATSDMYWAEDRLGGERVKGAYAYRQLLDENGWIPLGTDFPVEDISPIKTFYAAVVRKDAKGWPDKGFQPENALTREQALRGMTIWAARANFEETEKGSLEPGKFADFVLLDKDLMTAGEHELLSIKVEKTFLSGKLVFERN